MNKPDGNDDKSSSAKGGRARAERLSPEQRRAIAREAAAARWSRETPLQATHTGIIEIAGNRIACAVLKDGRRLLTQETFLKAMGRAGKAKAGTGSAELRLGLPPFLAAANLEPYITPEIRARATPILFRPERGGKAYGFEAELLPMVCEVYLQARDEKKILHTQERIVAAADLLMRGLARIGIIALVDEATGYQEQRARDELSQILNAYIAEELRPWVRMFPHEFFRQVYRLYGWDYREGQMHHPQVMGNIINRFIYRQLPPGVLDELRERNPIQETGNRRHKHHQFLTEEIGVKHLDKQISAITTLMRVSKDINEFKILFERAFKPQPADTRTVPVVDVPKHGAVKIKRRPVMPDDDQDSLF